MRRPLPRTVSALTARLLLAACSATGGHGNTSPRASVSVAAAGAVQESGRTLTQAQLLGAGPQMSQWPKDIASIADGGPVWQAVVPSTPPQVPPACHPLADLLWETSGPGAAVSMGFQPYNSTILGQMSLASYPDGRSTAFFASVRQAVGACPGFVYSNDYGTYHDEIVALQGPRLGDEAISFGVRFDLRGTEFLDRYDYVRVGAATVLVKQGGATVAVPASVPPLLAPQVARLQAAQS